MTKIISVSNGDSGASARSKINTAIASVEVDSTLVGDGNIGTPLGVANVLDNQIIVKQASDLSGTLSSTKVYFIDGIIDMGSQSIEVPAGGLNIVGYDFDVSKLITSQAAHKLFTSPLGGSGNFLMRDVAIEVTGVGSQVYDLVDSDGSHAFEVARVNYNNCTSLGELTSYRQGFEQGTGRFGATPSLTLSGSWSGGFFIDSSIVRGLSPAFTGAIFEEGTLFTMASRFRSNQNIDLPTNASFFDFQPSNFPNANTVQLKDCLVSRQGVFDETDPNITPNFSSGDLQADWSGCVGIRNTQLGGFLEVTAEIATAISAQNVWQDLAGTFTASELGHFDSPSNGQLRNLGNSPTAYKLTANLILESTANDVLELRVRRWDNSASAFFEDTVQARQVNSLIGARDVAIFNFTYFTTLEENDYIYLQVRNTSSATDITAEVSSFFFIEAR